MQVTAGKPYPLGATPDVAGTNFAITARDAHKVVLCLIDLDGQETQLELSDKTGTTWHIHVADVGDGQRFGWRIHGPWEPANGLLELRLANNPFCSAL